MSTITTEPPLLTDEIRRYLLNPGASMFSADVLLDLALDRLLVLEAQFAIAKKNRDAVTLQDVLTRYPASQDWFQACVIDQIDISGHNPCGFRDKLQFEAILRLARKKTAQEQPPTPERAPGFGEF